MRENLIRPYTTLLLAASTVLVGAAGNPALAQGGTHTVSGIVRGRPNDEPLAGALIDLRADAKQFSARSDQFGAFEITTATSGTYRMTLRRIGYLELTRDFVVAGRDTAITLTLDRRVQMLDTMHVRASVTAIYGVVGTSAALLPIPGAKVTVVGVGKAETTDSAGRFFVPLKKPGTYFLRVAKPGYTHQVLTLDVPTDRSVETSALLDSSAAAARPGTERLWQEFDKRVEWNAMNSALVTSVELRKFESMLLSEAIRSSPSFAKRGLKIGNSACVFLNGTPRPGLTLDGLRVEEVEAVELYGAGGDPTNSLLNDWPRGVPCSEVNGIRMPRRPATGTVVFVSVWLKP
jgi:hypothetical protein